MFNLIDMEYQKFKEAMQKDSNCIGGKISPESLLGDGSLVSLMTFLEEAVVHTIRMMVRFMCF